MKIIFILFIFFYSLTAEEIAVIKKINGNKIETDKVVKKGISGIVLCPYEKREIICARVVMFENKGKLKVYDDLKNNSFALPIVKPQPNDKIVLGKNYNRVMIIAPNQESYLKVENMFQNKTFISPDIFATFLEKKPTKKDFVNFAKKMDIGLYIFILDKIYLVDAYSFYAIKKINFNNKAKYNIAFFNTYNLSFKNGFFSKIFKKKTLNYENYYKQMIKE